FLHLLEPLRILTDLRTEENLANAIDIFGSTRSVSGARHFLTRGIQINGSFRGHSYSPSYCGTLQVAPACLKRLSPLGEMMRYRTGKDYFGTNLKPRKSQSKEGLDMAFDPARINFICW